MPDVFTKSKRSYVMSRIRSRGNQGTEVALAKFLRHHKITGWRRHLEIRKSYIGNRIFKVHPDFVFRHARLALFVDGCFWHGCPRCYRRPKSNRKFWDAKITRNRRRDRQVTRALRRAAWKVLRIWELHDLSRAIKNEKHATRLLNRIATALGALTEKM